MFVSVLIMMMTLISAQIAFAQQDLHTRDYLAELKADPTPLKQVTAGEIQKIILHSDEYVGKTFSAVGNIGYSIGDNALWKNNVVTLYVIDGKGEKPWNYSAALFDRNMFTRARAEKLARKVRARPFGYFNGFKILPELNSTFLFTILPRDNSGDLPVRLISITHPDGTVTRF